MQKQPWTPQIAEYIAQDTSRNAGFNDPPTMLRFSENGTFLLGDHIVRVDQGKKDRFGGENLGVLLEYLEKIGIHTIAPVASLPRYVSPEGFHGVFYPFVPTKKNTEKSWGENIVDFGKQIRKLHDFANPDEVTKIAPEWLEMDYGSRKIAAIQNNLITALEEKGTSLPVDKIELLLERSEFLSMQIESNPYVTKEEEESVVLHGDAHTGNIHETTSGIMVIDFEEVGLGARFMDHLHLLLAEHLFDIEPTYNFFAEGYGKSFWGEKNLQDWLELTALVYMSWATRLGSVSAPHAIEAERRFCFWEHELHESNFYDFSKKDVPHLWSIEL